MLDTNILIYLIKHKTAAVAQRVDTLGDDDSLCMSFVTFAELLVGAERSMRKAQVLRQFERLTAEIPVLHGTDRALCQHYAMQFARLHTACTPIGANDLWIACHALAADATLVTNTLALCGIEPPASAAP